MNTQNAFPCQNKHDTLKLMTYAINRQLFPPQEHIIRPQVKSTFTRVTEYNMYTHQKCLLKVKSEQNTEELENSKNSSTCIWYQQKSTRRLLTHG